MRTIQRAAAGTAAVSALGLTLAGGLAFGPATSARGHRIVAKDFTVSQILVGSPQQYADHVQGRVAPDADTTVHILVTDIDDPAASGGEVEILIDLSEVGGAVLVVGLSPDCNQISPDTVACIVPLPIMDPVTDPVPVPTQAIGLRAASGTSVGPAGTIHLSWGLGGNPAPTTAAIDVLVIAAQTATNPPTTNPPPPTTTAPPPTTPTVINPAPKPTTTHPSPSPPPTPTPTPTPEVTMTPDPTPEQNNAGGDPLAGGPPAAIPFATPPSDGPAWRSPALILSLGTAAAGLLIAMVYAAISLRRAGRD